MDESNLEESTPLIRDHGIPAPVRDNRSPEQRTKAVYLILASIAFERLAFYSLAINLVVTLQSTELNWSFSNSTTASFIFFGTSYISTVIFAAISDAKLGRAKTIIIGFCLYFASYIIIILIANANTHKSMCKNTTESHSTVLSEHCGSQIIGTLIFLAIGVGAVQPNMAVFGAEQIKNLRFTSRYFDKYYAAVNIGAIIAILSIPAIQNNTDNQVNPNNYFYGYLIAMFMLIIATILFIIGHRYYIFTPPHDTVIMQFIPVILNAYKNRQEYYKNRQTSTTNHTNSISIRPNNDGNQIMAHEERSMSFLDYAKSTNNGACLDRHVNDVKSVQRSTIVFLLLVPYWIIYHQIQITFPLQGKQMKIPLLNNGNSMPIAWMSLGDSVTIIVSIIILITFVYKYSDTQSRIKVIKVKIIIGMILSTLAMCIAGIIEIVRQHYCIGGDKQDSELSIYFQLPQTITMGLSEVFTTVATLEFAYMSAPRSAQSLLMSLQFCSVGIASFIANGYFSIYPTPSNDVYFGCNNLNRWTFTAYFFFLAILQIAFTFIFVICDRTFEILKLNPQQRI